MSFPGSEKPFGEGEAILAELRMENQEKSIDEAGSTGLYSPRRSEGQMD